MNDPTTNGSSKFDADLATMQDEARLEGERQQFAERRRRWTAIANMLGNVRHQVQLLERDRKAPRL